jgi:pimeloyl-ACP methyl ester carboxylesterase
MGSRPMDRVDLDGIELEYETRGTGEPVVLVHAGVFTGFSLPLLEQPALIARYRVVHYHRVGCAGSSRVNGPVSVADEAAHCVALMRRLGIDRAHIVGHSNSANLALQLALDSPRAVQSLVLIEPAFQHVPSAAKRAKEFLIPAFERYRAGDKAGAIDTFLRGTCGPNYRPVLDDAVPGAFDRAVADADTFFAQQLPALQAWSFGRDEASRVTHPVLAVIGAISQQLDPIWNERQELLLSWLPQAEPFVLPDATHLMAAQNPRGMAGAMTAFFARHPLASPRTNGADSR